MATRMQHPDHGFTYAYDDTEIARLGTYGWTVEGAASALKEALAESMRLDPPPTSLPAAAADYVRELNGAHPKRKYTRKAG